MKIKLHTLAIILFCNVLILTPSLAITPEPAADTNSKVAITGATLHTVSNGVIENGILTFENGKITGVYQAGGVDISGYQAINAEGQHVYPGFIMPDSQLGLVEVDALRHTRDFRERGDLNPSVRTLTSFNTDSELIPTMRFNGILIAQIAPIGGLVSGTSSIVQLDAWNWEDAALKIDDGVHINWPAKSYYKYDDTSDSIVLEPNKSYADDRSQLTTLFKDAAVNQDSNNLKLKALAGVFDGTQTLYLYADKPNTIIEAITLLKQAGVKRLVLKTGAGALLATEILQQHNIPVIIDTLHNLPGQDHHDIDQVYRLPQELQARGIRVGLSNNSWLMSTRNLAFNAGSAVAYGMPKDQALRMITLSNAEILGIADRVGSLEVGKDATLFISKGDALDMRGQQLTTAWIEGRQIELEAMQQELFQRFSEKYR